MNLTLKNVQITASNNVSIGNKTIYNGTINIHQLTQTLSVPQRNGENVNQSSESSNQRSFMQRAKHIWDRAIEHIIESIEHVIIFLMCMIFNKIEYRILYALDSEDDYYNEP